MLRDRLDEFHKKANVTGEDETQSIDDSRETNPNDVGEREDTVIEMQEAEDGNINRYLLEVNDTRQMIQDLKSDVDQVKILHNKILASPTSNDKLKLELDDLMSVVKTSSQVIRSKLKEMEQDNFKIEEKEEEKGSAPLRIRKTQHASLQQDFIDVMYRYQFGQTEYRDKCKARIKRQISITGKELSDDEVDDMIGKGNWSVFTRSIMLETRQAKQMLEDVEARHKDILKLEQSLLDLQGLFSELALMVETSGFKINSIAVSVFSTQDYVYKGKTEVKQALVLQKKARKKEICIAITLTTIILIIILIIILHFCKVF